jgi:ATP-dependent helicase HepA
MWFNIFDEERCASLEESAPEGNPFLDNQLIICSTEFLATSKKRTKQAISASWDMLVVDEAHHLKWSPNKVSPAYSVVELLSKVAKGLLLLTATPEQLGIESHFARLRLLDPERYSDYNEFVKESTYHKDIARIAEKLQSGKELNKNDIQLLESLFTKERIEKITKGDNESKEKLIEELVDQHGPGRVLFRNTRAAMSGFPKRKAHLIPLQVSDNYELWEQRLTDEFIYETSEKRVKTKQKFYFDKDPRFIWLLATLRKINPAKILLICKSKEKVLALEKIISTGYNLKVSVFHEDLTIVQRDRNAARFADEDGSQILICSEIGSEGRNFQFAHHLVLFDLPLHPELLEQRIGRLDRIGQTEDINIHIPYLENSSQHVLARWYHEGLNAFEQNLEGGNKIIELFGNKLLELCKSDTSEENRMQQIEQLITETSDFQKELQKNLTDGRDRLLEMNSYRPKVANKLIKQIQKEDSDKALEMFLTKVFRHFDIDMHRIASRTYFLRPASITTDIFPSIPSEGIRVTLNRERALHREDMSFLTWDHPMVTNSVDMVLSKGIGSASFGVLKGSGKAGLLLEIIFMLETSRKENINIDRFLPNTPLRIVVDHTCEDVCDLYSAEMLNKKIIPGQIDPFLDNEIFRDTVLPNMISAAKDIAEEQAAGIITNGLQKMNNTLNHEIERLQVLQTKNKNVRPQEIHIAQKEQETLASIIKNARIRMDAVLLISMG